MLSTSTTGYVVQDNKQLREKPTSTSLYMGYSPRVSRNFPEDDVKHFADPCYSPVTETMAENMQNQHHLAFGLIADVQYADVDDGTNYNQTRRRYYRAALQSLKKTISKWKNFPYSLAFVLQLGDLIDGMNRRKNGEKAVAVALETALAPFRELPCSTHHMIGNHDLYNMTRKECYLSELNTSRLRGAQSVEGAFYYSAVVHPRLKLVVLDTYDVGVLGFGDSPKHPHYLEAVEILHQNNPNEEKNSSVGVQGDARRFAAYNGGLGKEQLGWLNAQLTDADSKRQNVLLCGHVQLNPVLSEAVNTGTCLVWNYTDVQKILHSHGCVIGCLAGHDHDGSHSVDSAGIHHLVLNGVIETPPDSDAYAIAFLCDHTLEIEGAGVVPSVSLPLKYFANDEEIHV